MAENIHTGRSLNNTLNTSVCCQTPQEFTFVPLLYFLRKILIVSRCCRKGSAMIWPAKFHGTLLMLQAHRLVRTHPLITRDTWSLCCVLSLTVYQIFVILNLTRLLIMTGYSNTHIFWTKHSFFHISLKLDIDHAWGQICPAPCQLGWLDKQTGSVSKLPTAKGFWEHSLHLLAWWSGFMSNVSVIHTQRHANSSLTPEGSCKTPRAVKAKQRWCKTFLLSPC